VLFFFSGELLMAQVWTVESERFLTELRSIPGEKVVEYESRMKFGSGDFDIMDDE